MQELGRREVALAEEFTLEERERMGEAARTLGIHQNTLRYRLNRAAEVLDLQFDEPEVRFALQLAARLLEFEDVGEMAAQPRSFP